MRGVFCVLGLTLLAAATACGGSGSVSAPPSAPNPSLHQAVSFDLPSDSGQLVSIPSGPTKTTVVDFWAPTCVPCRKTLPELVARKADIEAKGARLVLVGVLADSESTELARNTLQSWGVQEPFLLDRGGVAQSQAGIRELPATLVIDADGLLRWVAPPGASAEDVLSAIPTR